MTCRYSETDWRDVLYNSVRRASGGVTAAAHFLKERRGKGIHPEYLRQRLRGVDGECVSMDMAELLTEWMQDQRCPDALDWLHAFNARFGVASEGVPVGQQDGGDVLAAVTQTLLRLTVHGGRLTEIGVASSADGALDDRELDAMEAQATREIGELFGLVRTVRAARKGGAA